MAITPGPWFHLSGGNISTRVGPDWAGHLVAEARTEEDASLIAASPEMLDSCVFFIGLVDTLEKFNLLQELDSIGGDSAGVLFMREQTRAAIARVRKVESGD